MVINNLTEGCNFEILNLKIKGNIQYQTIYKFGNQVCYGYNNTILNKYRIFKDQTQFFFFGNQEPIISFIITNNYPQNTTTYFAIWFLFAGVYCISSFCVIIFSHRLLCAFFLLYFFFLRYSHTAHVVNDHLVLVGGVSPNSTHTPGVVLLNLKSLSWKSFSLPVSSLLLSQYSIVLAKVVHDFTTRLFIGPVYVVLGDPR